MPIPRKMTLLNRIKRLERMTRLNDVRRKINERKIGRGGVESNAYIIWKFLVDNGPSTSKQIKDFFPANKRNSIASMLVDCERMDCIFRRGDKFEANLDYEWDDVGVIRPSLSDLKNAEPMDEPEDKQEELDIDDITIDELAEAIGEHFDKTSAASVASLVVERTTSNKIYYTVEFDNHDDVMKLTVKVSNGAVLFTMPCVSYDEEDNEVEQLDWKGQSEVKLSCNKLKTLQLIVMTLGNAISKFDKQL